MKKKILTWALASVSSVISLPATYAVTPSPPPVSQATENQYEAALKAWFDMADRSIEEVVAFIESLVYEGSYLTSIANWLQDQGGDASEPYNDKQGNQWKGTAALMGSPDDVPPEFLLTIEKNAESQQYVTKWRPAQYEGAQPLSSQSPNYYSVNLQPVPIDGGASMLLAAGAAYGLKRLRRRKEQQQ